MCVGAGAVWCEKNLNLMMAKDVVAAMLMSLITMTVVMMMMMMMMMRETRRKGEMNMTVIW